MSEDNKIENESLVKENSKDTNKNTIPENKTKSINKLFVVMPIIIVLIIFSIVTFYINDRLNEVEAGLKQNIDDNVSQINYKKIIETASRFTDVNNRLQELELEQKTLSQAFSQVSSQTQEVHVNKDYALAEIEHLLIIASYNLKLDHNIVTALSAMQSADDRLAGISDIAVLSVREQLVADMNELRSINQADLSGMTLFLSDLINRVDELSINENIVMERVETKLKPVDKQVEGIQDFFKLVFKELKSLIVITRDENVSKARLLPDEIYFLRANLKLELANARFSVFNRDTENLHASVDHMLQWLDSYFDTSEAAVRNIYDSLSGMKSIELAFPDVDINSSLESVRALRSSQDETDQMLSQ